MSLVKRNSAPLILAGYLAGLFLVYLALRPGLGVGFQFDSYPNLDTLRSVGDLHSALLYVFSGIAGPTGRPLSLLTFVFQADAWPGSPGSMMFVNLMIHMLNGVVLFGITWGLARLMAVPQRASVVAAMVASLLWLACPLLLSTTFSAIQRMTSLAATFMLLGVGGHLLIRERPRLGDSARLILLTLNLGLFTALALLSKENGLLLPVLILVLEITVLQPTAIRQERAWRLWKAVCLWVPLVVIGIYLATRWNYGEATLARRDFTAPERLMTQFVILWEYLFHTLLPALRNIGFFHDDYEPVRWFWSIEVLAAVFAWIAAVIAAFVGRRKFPLFSLAVFWYLGGHLLESTVVPLELYFEHRNYVPLMGVFMAVGIGLVRLPSGVVRMAGVAVGLYFSMMLVVSLLATSLWSRGLDAAEFWLESSPQSERAVTYYMREQLREDNPRAAVAILEQAAYNLPESALFFDVSRLWLKCQFDGLEGVVVDFDDIVARLPAARYHVGVVGVLSDLYELRTDPRCGQISADDLEAAVDELLKNPNYAGMKNARHSVNRIKANLLHDSGREIESIEFYEHALIAKESVPMLMHLARLYGEHELYHRGCEFTDRLVENAPGRFYIRSRWLAVVRSQRRWIGNQSPQGDCRVLISDGVGQ